MLKDWEELPEKMKTEAVRPYYEILRGKKFSLAAKRAFDVTFAAALLVALSPVMAAIAFFVARSSEGGAIYRQERVTQYGRTFTIYKFRTMINGADKLGASVTANGDARVTPLGRTLRKYRLDETPQLLNIIKGDMSFVGTRPEAPKYVAGYGDEMYATLLMPAGVTSEASIRYKDEEKLLEGASSADETYMEKILPEKMKYNLQSIRDFSLFGDFLTMARTLYAVAR